MLGSLTPNRPETNNYFNQHQLFKKCPFLYLNSLWHAAFAYRLKNCSRSAELNTACPRRAKYKQIKQTPQTANGTEQNKTKKEQRWVRLTFKKLGTLIVRKIFLKAPGSVDSSPSAWVNCSSMAPTLAPTILTKPCRQMPTPEHSIRDWCWTNVVVFFLMATL